MSAGARAYGRTWFPGLVVVLAVLVVACGPNALPGRDTRAAAAPGVAARPAAPLAQLFGGSGIQGRLLFVKDGNLWLWEKGNAREVAQGETWAQPSWSPDGSRFAYVFKGTNFSDIFVGDLQGSLQRRLTRSQSPILEDNDWNFRPAWSPDGKLIAFTSDANSYDPTLWVMNAADGTGRRQVTFPSLQQDATDGLSWDPGGGRLAMAVFSGGAPSQIAIVPLGAAAARESPRVVTEYPSGALDPAWSPDGRWIAYAAREGKGMDIFVMRPDGTGKTRLTDTGSARSPTWSPDGRQLAYISSQTGSFEIWVLDATSDSSGTLQAANPRQVTRDLGVDATSGVSWAR